MKIVLTDAQTVVDNLVPADRLSQFGEVVQYGLLTYDEVAEKIADADLLHRRNFPAQADNHLHGRKGKCGQDHKEDALLFLCDIHDVLL